MGTSRPGRPGREGDEIRLAAMLRGGWRRALAAMARALAEHGLSGLEYHALLAIGAAGRTGVRQVDLAQELSVPEGHVSSLARQLRERGLIEALRSEPDRRYVRLRLRAAGRLLLRAAMRSQRQHLAAMVARIPEDQVDRMIEFLAGTYLGLQVTVRRG